MFHVKHLQHFVEKWDECRADAMQGRETMV